MSRHAASRASTARSARRGTELEPYNSAFYRGLGLPVAGGMVLTAACALALVRAFAGVPSGYLPAALLAEATSDQAGDVPGIMGGFREWPRAAWGLGVELKGEKTHGFPPRASSPASFGHSGHAGCLAWHEPATGVSWFVHGLRTADQCFKQLQVVSAAVLQAAGDG